MAHPVNPNGVVRPHLRHDNLHSNFFSLSNVPIHEARIYGHIRGCVFENSLGDQVGSFSSGVVVDNSTITQTEGVDKSTLNSGKSGKNRKPHSKTGKDVKPKGKTAKSFCYKNRVECKQDGSKIYVCHMMTENRFKSKCIKEENVRSFIKDHPNDFCGKCPTESTTSTTTTSLVTLISTVPNITCDDNDLCTINRYDNDSGQCTYAPVECRDGEVCDKTDGVCKSVVPTTTLTSSSSATSTIISVSCHLYCSLCLLQAIQ